MNYAVEQVNDPDTPGFKDIVDRLASRSPLAPEEFVESTLELAGYVTVDEDTRQELLDHAELGGDLSFVSEAERDEIEKRVLQMLRLIVSTREYQFN